VRNRQTPLSCLARLGLPPASCPPSGSGSSGTMTMASSQLLSRQHTGAQTRNLSDTLDSTDTDSVVNSDCGSRLAADCCKCSPALQDRQAASEPEVGSCWEGGRGQSPQCGLHVLCSQCKQLLCVEIPPGCVASPGEKGPDPPSPPCHSSLQARSVQGDAFGLF